MNDTASTWLGREYFDNQARRNPEDLLRYAGQYIAWSWDGAEVVASGQSEGEVRDKLLAQGLDIHRVVYDYIDPL